MNDIEFRNTMTRAWLESWIGQNQKPNWYSWLGFYPAKSSVEAARAQLRAMNSNLCIGINDAVKIFNET